MATELRQHHVVTAYAGAVGRLDIAQVSRLSPSRYCVQPKIDGCYAEVHCGADGRVERILSRTGRELESSLIGIQAMPGHCVLVGELEAHTEAGIAAAGARGYQSLHLFDIIMPGTYRERRDHLWRGQSMVASDQGRLSQRRDRSGRYHDSGGHFSAFSPTDWRRFPIVESLPVASACDLWDQARTGQIEGFVVVDLDAPLARRNAKRKVKPIDTLDCLVLAADARVATLRTFGREFLCACNGLDLLPGDHVAVHHNGWYASGEPRFPRIDRKRTEWQSPKRPSSLEPSEMARA